MQRRHSKHSAEDWKCVLQLFLTQGQAFLKVAFLPGLLPIPAFLTVHLRIEYSRLHSKVCRTGSRFFARYSKSQGTNKGL